MPREIVRHPRKRAWEGFIGPCARCFGGVLQEGSRKQGPALNCVFSGNRGNPKNDCPCKSYL